MREYNDLSTISVQKLQLWIIFLKVNELFQVYGTLSLLLCNTTVHTT